MKTQRHREKEQHMKEAETEVLLSTRQGTPRIAVTIRS